MTAELSPRSPRRQQTRERLMDAAYELFAEEGVHATPIEAIAEAAGFTRGAFYSNFESKNDLFFALADREWDLRLTIVRNAIADFAATAPSGQLDQQVSALLIEVFSALPDDRKWALIYREFELLALRDEAIAPQYLDHQRAFHGQLTEVLTFAAERFGVAFTTDPADVAALLTLVHENANRGAMLAGAPDTQEATRDELLRILPPLLHHFTGHTT